MNLQDILTGFVIVMALAGITFGIISIRSSPDISGVGHFMAVNLTKDESGWCRITWLGGTDYDSFVKDLKVGNESVGHPDPGTVIYEGTECNTTVGMYFRDVKAYQTIWPRGE